MQEKNLINVKKKKNHPKFYLMMGFIQSYGYSMSPRNFCGYGYFSHAQPSSKKKTLQALSGKSD